MPKQLRFLPAFLMFFVLLLPSFASAKTVMGIVVCGNASVNGEVPVSEQCTFNDLINEVQVVINFLIFKIAAPLAAVMFVYAGFLYLTNGGNESRVRQAHEVFWNVFIGLVVALAAWIVMSFILTFFLGANSAFNFLK